MCKVDLRCVLTLTLTLTPAPPPPPPPDPDPDLDPAPDPDPDADKDLTLPSPHLATARFVPEVRRVLLPRAPPELLLPLTVLAHPGRLLPQDNLHAMPQVLRGQPSMRTICTPPTPVAVSVRMACVPAHVARSSSFWSG